MKKASFVSLVLLVLTANSLVFAQPAKVLLLEPETEKVPYSTACEVYGWMGEVYEKYGSYLESVNIQQARDTLITHDIFLSKCRTPEDYYKVGSLLKINQIAHSKLIATELQYIISVTVYDINSKTLLFKKETALDITCKNDIYDLATNATTEFTDSIYNFHLNGLENEKDTTTALEKSVDFRKISDIVGEKEYNKYTKIQFKKIPDIKTDTSKIIYPTELKDRGIEGRVYMHLLVDETGKVSMVYIAKSSGNDLLDSAAINAVNQFEFSPAISNDNKAHSFWNTFPLIYELKYNKVSYGVFSKMDKAPEIVYKITPAYPQEAKEKGIQGKVILYILIGRNGKVKQVDIAKSAGSDLLDEAAKQTAYQFIFRPAVAPGGKFVRVWVTYPVTFKLDDYKDTGGRRVFKVKYQ